MAIFSQKNNQTSIDFRKYDYQSPNRTIPFLLGDELEVKINLLMEKLKLDTGSIDMILDKNGRYIFLEVNPVGQFGMVSRPCNYYLEKKVANYLVNKNNHNEIYKKKNHQISTN